MMTRVACLDHGYVQLVDLWGRLDITDMPGDEAIVAAARMSTGKGFECWRDHAPGCPLEGDRKVDATGCATCVSIPKDEKLLRYLYTNQHSTPFEAAGATFEIMAPIFVFREWHRHRTQSFNEASSRYAPLPDVNYVPTIERLMANANSASGNKQAGTVKGAESLTEEGALHFQSFITRHYNAAQIIYEEALRSGVPKELARVHLPVGRYSKMRASANLRNWLQFLTLRQAPAAQFEIRVYADAVHDLLQRHFGRTIALFDEKRTK